MKKPIELELRVMKGGVEEIQISFAALAHGSVHVLLLPDKYDEYEDGEIVKVVISELDEKDKKIAEFKKEIESLKSALLEETDKNLNI